MIEKVITMKSFIQVQIPGIILPSLRYIHTDQFLATHTDQFLAIVLMLVTLLTVLMGRHLQLQMWILMIV